MPEATPTPQGPEREGRQRIATTVAHLDRLVGGHPEALTKIFSDGSVPTAEHLTAIRSGRVLTLGGMRDVFLAARPLVRALARTPIWKGKAFDHGGNAGSNLFFGTETLRFSSSLGTSRLDGKEAIILQYPRAPFPLRAMVDEIRAVDDEILIGAAYLRPETPTPTLWFGLSTATE